MCAPNFMAISPIAVGTFQAEPKWWSHAASMAKNKDPLGLAASHG